MVTPSGALLAPDVVELRLNPDDLSSLTERMDARPDQRERRRGVRGSGGRARRPPRRARAGRGARHRRPVGPAGPLPAAAGQPVDVGAPPAQPGPQLAARGRGRLPAPGMRCARRWPWRPRRGPQPPGCFVGHDGSTRSQPEPGASAVTGMPTVSGTEPPARSRCCGWSPADSVAETRTSGRPRRAGRGGAGAARGAHGVPGARQVHVLRRPVVDRQPGPQRAHPERRRAGRGAAAQRRRFDPLGNASRTRCCPGSRSAEAPPAGLGSSRGPRCR